MERDKSREALAAATGFTDEALLNELIDSGITATTLVALAMVPLVMVAWSDADIASHALSTEAIHRHGSLAAVELWHGGAAVMNRASGRKWNMPEPIVRMVS